MGLLYWYTSLTKYYFLFKTRTGGICKKKKGGREVTSTAALGPGPQTISSAPLLGIPAFPESALAIRAVQSATYSDHSCGSPDCIASGVLA